MSQSEMFPSNRLPENEPWVQSRNMRDPIMSDRAFAPLLCGLVYEAGPHGILMRQLIDEGINRGWWQDTADKHFGEKMRCAWAYGLIVVPDKPGDQTPRGKRVIHPAFFEIRFQSGQAQRSWTFLVDALKKMNFFKIRC